MAATDPEVLSGPDSGAPPPVTDSGKTPGGEEKKPETKPDAKAEAKAARDIEREVSELKAQLAEVNQTALHWYNKAQGITKPRDEDDEDRPAKTAKSKTEPDDDEDPEKFVDNLASKGSKALDEYMAKRGYMPGDQVQKLLDQKLGAATAQAQLAAKYPDLEDENSELFKETQKDYQEMVSLDKRFANSPAAVKIAAKSAAARIKASAEIAEAKKPKETEAERRTRIAAQQGDPGRRGGAEFEDEAPGQLTDLQKHMLERFNAAGGGPDIDPEKLMKRMKAGVRMQFVPGRDSQGRFQ